MQETNTSFTMPSGARITLQDDDGELARYFKALFGSTEAGLAIVSSAARKKRRDEYGSTSL